MNYKPIPPVYRNSSILLANYHQQFLTSSDKISTVIGVRDVNFILVKQLPLNTNRPLVNEGFKTNNIQNNFIVGFYLLSYYIAQILLYLRVEDIIHRVHCIHFVRRIQTILPPVIRPHVELGIADLKLLLEVLHVPPLKDFEKGTILMVDDDSD